MKIPCARLLAFVVSLDVQVFSGWNLKSLLFRLLHNLKLYHMLDFDVSNRLKMQQSTKSRGKNLNIEYQVFLFLNPHLHTFIIILLLKYPQRWFVDQDSIWQELNRQEKLKKMGQSEYLPKAPFFWCLGRESNSYSL